MPDHQRGGRDRRRAMAGRETARELQRRRRHGQRAGAQRRAVQCPVGRSRTARSSAGKSAQEMAVQIARDVRIAWLAGQAMPFADWT